MMFCRVFLPALVLFGIAAPALATTVYQNGDANRIGGSGLDSNFNAHDFKLATDASLTGMTLYVLDVFGTIGTGPMNYVIHDNDPVSDDIFAVGSPGNILASGMTSAVSITALGRQQGVGDPEYRLSFQFLNPVTVAGGVNYWIALRYGDGSQQGSLLWSSIGPNGTSSGVEFRDGEWISGSPEASFSLQSGVAAVPEPASWALFLAGFGLMGARLRRQRTTPPRREAA